MRNKAAVPSLFFASMVHLVLLCQPSHAESIDSSVTGTRFEPWQKADKLFRSDPQWRGGDSAYSVSLGGEQILWLFGDSFVGRGSGQGRKGRKMVRNTIAVQEGLDPTKATLQFYWKDDDKKPGAFFEGKGNEWLWPGPGQRIGSTVLLTFNRLVKKGTGIFGFETVGSKALFLLNPAEDPTTWRFEETDLPPRPEGVQFGTGSLLLHRDFLYGYPVKEPGSHDVYLCRWPTKELEKKDLTKARWWDGTTWCSSPEGACVVASTVQTEFSVTGPGPSARFWMVSVHGFGGTDVVARTSPRPEGPWTGPRTLYRPPESDCRDVFVYSAKAHPHGLSEGLVFTYCTNHVHFATLIQDMNLYFPRFVRGEF